MTIVTIMPIMPIMPIMIIMIMWHDGVGLESAAIDCGPKSQVVINSHCRICKMIKRRDWLQIPWLMATWIL